MEIWWLFHMESRSHDLHWSRCWWTNTQNTGQQKSTNGMMIDWILFICPMQLWTTFFPSSFSQQLFLFPFPPMVEEELLSRSRIPEKAERNVQDNHQNVCICPSRATSAVVCRLGDRYHGRQYLFVGPDLDGRLSVLWYVVHCVTLLRRCPMATKTSTTTWTNCPKADAMSRKGKFQFKFRFGKPPWFSLIPPSAAVLVVFFWWTPLSYCTMIMKDVTTNWT